LAVSRDTGDHNHVEYCVGEREAFGHSAYVAQRVNIRRGHGILIISVEASTPTTCASW
jgi:hypothetical protein